MAGWISCPFHRWEVGFTVESDEQPVVVARQGHNEVLVRWHRFGVGVDIASVRDELFAAVFERLG